MNEVLLNSSKLKHKGKLFLWRTQRMCYVMFINPCPANAEYMVSS